MAATLARPNATPASPLPRLGLGRLLGINAFYFGYGAHWPAILGPLLTVGATVLVAGQADILIGQVTAAGAVFAALVPLAAGWLSDRTASRWGRRRPWMVAGTGFNLVGLGMLAVAGSPLLLLFGFLVVQISNNAAGAAYAGVIPDVVPEQQRGQASGLLGTLNLLGTVLGVGLVTVMLGRLGSGRAGLIASYACIAVILLVSLVITVAAVQEQPGIRSSMPWPGWRGFLSPFRHRDFFWVFLTRALVQLGLISIYTFIGLYFRDVVGGANYGAASGLWLLTVIAGGALTAVIGGYVSDRTGRRKFLVYVSSALQAAVVVIMVFSLSRSLPALYLLGVIYGLGYGAYYAVDWALACDVLPDREQAAGKDMALWHTSLTIPQAIAPAVLGGVLHFLNTPGHAILGIATGTFLGFRFLFGTAAVFFVLGTVMVRQIRGVR